MRSATGSRSCPTTRAGATSTRSTATAPTCAGTPTTAAHGRRVLRAAREHGRHAGGLRVGRRAVDARRPGRRSPRRARRPARRPAHRPRAAPHHRRRLARPASRPTAPAGPAPSRSAAPCTGSPTATARPARCSPARRPGPAAPSRWASDRRRLGRRRRRRGRPRGRPGDPRADDAPRRSRAGAARPGAGARRGPGRRRRRRRRARRPAAARRPRRRRRGPRGGPRRATARSPAWPGRRTRAWLAYADPAAPGLRQIVAGAARRRRGRRGHRAAGSSTPTRPSPGRQHLAFLSARSFDPVYDEHVFDLSFPASWRPYLVPLGRPHPVPVRREPGRAARPRRPTRSPTTCRRPTRRPVGEGAEDVPAESREGRRRRTTPRRRSSSTSRGWPTGSCRSRSARAATRGLRAAQGLPALVRLAGRGVLGDGRAADRREAATGPSWSATTWCAASST